MRYPVTLKHLGKGTSRPPIWVAVLLACAFQLPVWASPPPVPRSQLPRIESQLQGRDAKLQVQALHDLSSLEGNITKDLMRLLPRVLELGRSSDDNVTQAALYVLGHFAWLSEAREKHGREMIEVIGRALDSKTADVRTAALYVMYPALVDEQFELAGPLLISAAVDEVEAARVSAVITLGKIQKTNAKIVDTLRKALSDPAMQVRRQSAYSLASLAPASKAAIPELLKAMRDEHAEVRGGAAYGLQMMGDDAVEGLLALTDAPEATVRDLALHALATGYSPGAKYGERIYAMVERKLDDPDPAVQASAAIRISIFGTLTARVAAIPILVKTAADKKADAYGNAYVGIHRCIKVLAADLTDQQKASDAFRGFRQFDKAFLKAFLLETQRKYKGSEGGDVVPLFKAAAARGIAAEHREFASEVLMWLEQEK
jgi:HEAT repeat protein